MKLIENSLRTECLSINWKKALNTEEKLIIVLVFLIRGMIGYAVCEVVDRSRSKVNEVTEEFETNEKAELEAEL